MTTTHYIWDEENDSYFMETDGDGNVTAVYTNEPVPYGRVISQRRGNATSFYHYDGQGSTRQLTDENGNVTDEYAYTAFGETVASSGATVNPFGYKGALGYYADGQTDTYYVRSRHQSPTNGRWSSLDPIGFFAGYNRFTYVMNRPTMFADPLGLLYWEGPEAAIVSFIDHFTPTVDLFWDMMKEARQAGLQQQLQPGDLSIVMFLLSEIALSANPRPNPSYANWKPLLDSKEHRGFLRAQLQVRCGCGLIEDYRTNWYADPGWTPIRLAYGLNDYERGDGESHSDVAYAQDINAMSWVYPPQSPPTCINAVFKNQWRLGLFGQLINRFFLGVEPPFAWGDIEYRMCCNGKYKIDYFGSDLPSHFAYLQKTKVGQRLQTDIAAFIFRTPGARASGSLFHTESGTATARPNWTIY